MVVARDAAIGVRLHGRDDVVWSAKWPQRHLHTATGGLVRFDENKFMPMANDHGSGREDSNRTMQIKINF
jgi:hypothetical protein